MYNSSMTFPNIHDSWPWFSLYAGNNNFMIIFFLSILLIKNAVGDGVSAGVNLTVGSASQISTIHLQNNQPVQTYSRALHAAASLPRAGALPTTSPHVPGRCLPPRLLRLSSACWGSFPTPIAASRRAGHG
jgi:hypothetical protein